MKKEYIIIGAVVLTIGYFVWRNNRTKLVNGNENTGNTPKGDVILSFGNGGGFAGIETTYNLMSNGDIVRAGGVLLKVGSLNNATLDKVKSFVSKYKDFKYSKNDNMYSFIYINGNHIVWGFSVPNQDIFDIYSVLNLYTKDGGVSTTDTQIYRCKDINGNEVIQYHTCVMSDINIDNDFWDRIDNKNTATCPNGVKYDPNAQYILDPCA